MSRATPPCTGIDPPQTPLRPAAGVTGTTASLQAARTSATCATEVGRTTTAGRCGTAPSAAQPMASGHQSRPASARASSSVDHGGAAGPDAVEDGSGHVDRRRAQAIRDVRAPARQWGWREWASSRQVEPGRQELLLGGLDEAGGLVGRLLARPSPCRERSARRPRARHPWWRAPAGCWRGSAATGRRRASVPSPRGRRTRARRRCRAAPPPPVRAVRDGRPPRRAPQRPRCRSGPGVAPGAGPAPRGPGSWSSRR